MKDVPLYILLDPVIGSKPRLKKRIAREDISRPIIELFEYMLDPKPDELNLTPYGEQEERLADYINERYEVIKSLPNGYTRYMFDLLGIRSAPFDVTFLFESTKTGNPRYKPSIQDYPDLIRRMEDEQGVRDEAHIVYRFLHGDG